MEPLDRLHSFAICRIIGKIASVYIRSIVLPVPMSRVYLSNCKVPRSVRGIDTGKGLE